mmetsp:Transcript_55917/g.181523  ORF Transcript_55917/g.181523 Transcript_55917/m.181523 type:complete len:291 (+) Transcript_55917:215-1087(+)
MLGEGPRSGVPAECLPNGHEGDDRPEGDAADQHEPAQRPYRRRRRSGHGAAGLDRGTGDEGRPVVIQILLLLQGGVQSMLLVLGHVRLLRVHHEISSKRHRRGIASLAFPALPIGLPEGNALALGVGAAAIPALRRREPSGRFLIGIDLFSPVPQVGVRVLQCNVQRRPCLRRVRPLGHHFRNVLLLRDVFFPLLLRRLGRVVSELLSHLGEAGRRVRAEERQLVDGLWHAAQQAHAVVIRVTIDPGALAVDGLQILGLHDGPRTARLGGLRGRRAAIRGNRRVRDVATL